MISTTTADHARLADDFWLAMHDNLYRQRTAVPSTSCRLALSCALLVELADLGAVDVGVSGARHRAAPADADVTLHARPAHGRLGDPALAEVHASIARGNMPTDTEHPDALEYPRHRAQPVANAIPEQPTHVPPWFASDTANVPAPGAEPAVTRSPSRVVPAQRGTTAYRQDPPAAGHGRAHAAAPAGGVTVRTLLEWWALEGRAESLVINRLLATGLVRYRGYRRVLGGEKQVITPRDSVVSGRPIARITGGLQPPSRYLVRRGEDPRKPRGLTDYDKRLAGLFAAVGMFDLDRTKLNAQQLLLLREQMQTGVPPGVAMLLRQLNIAIKSLALHR